MDPNVAYPLVRSVSKTGGFDLEIDTAHELASSLSNEDSAKLYVLIRDESQREEREWRDAFIDLFPDSEPLLPACDAPEFDPNTLFDLIELSATPGNECYLDEFESYMMDADDLGVDLSELTKDGLTLREFAKQVGNSGAIETLDEFSV